MRYLRWILSLSILLALTSCALGRPPVFMHAFSFDTFLDSPDVEILDYQYGSNGQFGTGANEEMAQRGDTFPRWQTYGAMPRGDYLYVKWRMKSSQEHHEEKVDLRNRLPKNITNYEIHFVIKDSQLYIYLIPPPGGWDPLLHKREPDYLMKHQIYPSSSAR